MNLQLISHEKAFKIERKYIQNHLQYLTREISVIFKDINCNSNSMFCEFWYPRIFILYQSWFCINP